MWGQLWGVPVRRPSWLASAHDFHQDCCKLSYEKKENKKRTQIGGGTQRWCAGEEVPSSAVLQAYSKVQSSVGRRLWTAWWEAWWDSCQRISVHKSSSGQALRWRAEAFSKQKKWPTPVALYIRFVSLWGEGLPLVRCLGFSVFSQWSWLESGEGLKGKICF